MRIPQEGGGSDRTNKAVGGQPKLPEWYCLADQRAAFILGLADTRNIYHRYKKETKICLKWSYSNHFKEDQGPIIHLKYILIGLWSGERQERRAWYKFLLETPVSIFCLCWCHRSYTRYQWMQLSIIWKAGITAAHWIYIICPRIKQLIFSLPRVANRSRNRD